MGQSGQRRNAAKKDAQIMSNEEEYVFGMEQKSNHAAMKVLGRSTDTNALLMDAQTGV